MKGILTHLRLMLITILYIGVLTGCGDGEGESMEETRHSTVEENSQESESSSAEEETEAETLGIAITLDTVIKKVTGISEWQSGKYVVNGFDFEGQPVGVVVDSNGTVKLYESYCALFPLADGKLLAAKRVGILEEGGMVTTEFMSPGTIVAADDAWIVGDIIDEAGNVLFTLDSSIMQQMYLVNSKHIFVVSAERGFEGAKVKFGVLDCNGNWTAPLEENMYSKTFAEKIVMEDDGVTWKLYADVYRSQRYGEREGTCIEFMLSTIVVTGTSLSSVYEKKTLYMYRCTGKTNSPFYVTSVTGYPAAELYFKDEIDGARNISLKEYGATIHVEHPYPEYMTNMGAEGKKGVVYFWNTYTYEVYNTEDQSTWKFPYEDRSIRSIDLIDGRFVLEVTGADKNRYVTVWNNDEVVQLEPFFVHGECDSIDLKDNQLVYIDGESSMYLIDIETQIEMKISYEKMPGTPYKVDFMGDELISVTVRIGSSRDNNICELIYSMKEQRWIN